MSGRVESRKPQITSNMMHGLRSGREVKEPTDERLVAMHDKLCTEEGKALYAKRNHTVEAVFG